MNPPPAVPAPNAEAARVAELLRDRRRILIAAHLNPDGDALGSAAALAHIALALGAEARLLLVSGVPDFLDWLPLPCVFEQRVESFGDWVPDLLIVADCGDTGRCGPELDAYFQRGDPPAPGWENVDSLNIDHHSSNTGFARHNWVEPGRAATGELVGLLAEACGLPLAGPLASAVYLCLVSDTGNFSYSNSTSDAFAMAARITANGLDIAEFTAAYENNWSLKRLHLWGRLFSEITLHLNGAVALCIVTQAHLKEFGLKKSDLDGLAAWLRRIRGVKVGLFVREDTPRDGASRSKLSLRSMGDIDVSRIAAAFGGGGHAGAAGADCAVPPIPLARAVLGELEKLLKLPEAEEPAA